MKLLTSIVTVCLATLAPAQVVLRDGDFGSWRVRQSPTSGTLTHETATTGGNPGANLRFRFQSSGGKPGSGQFLGWHRTQSYDPAVLGPIAHVTFQVDSLGEDEGIAPVVIQGGTFYTTPQTGPTGRHTSWTTIRLSGPATETRLTEASFRNITVFYGGRVTLGNATPDFSAKGLPILFGFLNRNHTTTSVEHRYDNWLVTVDPAWSDLGGGHRVANPPRITRPAEMLRRNTTIAIPIRGAASANGLIAFGASRVNLPLRGATLVPSPDALFPFRTDSSGTFVLRGTTAANASFLGVVIYLQAGIEDRRGLLLTNGWRATGR